jgi:hypothetical protein
LGGANFVPLNDADPPGSAPAGTEKPTAPASAGNGNPLSHVTSSLRRAGSTVKRLGRKILLDTTSVVLPERFNGRHAEVGSRRVGTSNAWETTNGDNDRTNGAASSPPSQLATRRVSKRYLDLGPLDPRRLREGLAGSSGFGAERSKVPPEGYVNVWQGNFRRWQKRWVVATVPGVLTMHNRSSKLGPSVSVDLTNATVLVAGSAEIGEETTHNTNHHGNKTNSQKHGKESGTARQFLVVTPDKTFRIRALHSNARALWVECVRNSAAKLERARALVRARSVAGGGSFASRKNGSFRIDGTRGGFSGGSGIIPEGTPHMTSIGNQAETPERSKSLSRPPSGRSAKKDLRKLTIQVNAERTPGFHSRTHSAVSELALAEKKNLLKALFTDPTQNPELHNARTSAFAAAQACVSGGGVLGSINGFLMGKQSDNSDKGDSLRSSSSFEDGKMGDTDPDANLETKKTPKNVLDAVHLLDAAYTNTINGLIQQLATASEKAERLTLRSTHLAHALAEFTGVVPSPSGGDIDHENGNGFGAQTQPNVVTPGQASFANALQSHNSFDGNAPESSAYSENDPDKDSDDSDDSDAYGSVLSFATGVSGGSFGGGGVSDLGNVDDVDLLVAAEVVNRHDFVLSKSFKIEKNESGGTFPVGNDDDVSLSGSAHTSVSDASDDDENSDDENDDETDELNFAPRERLPAPQPLNQSFSLWSILKQSIGKDLSRISMPANINQPLTLIQRTVEDFESLDLLYKAIECDGESGSTNSTNRVALLAAFAASSYASWYGRAQKPFASTLGETFDWVSSDGLVKIVCECVVYDPPVAAFHAKGTTPNGTPFEVHGEGMGTSKFYGRFVQVNVNGGLHLVLPTTGEKYSWSKAAMHVHNVISGKVWVDMVGQVDVLAHPVVRLDTGKKVGGESAVFKLLKGAKPTAGKQDTRGTLVGEIFDKHGVKTGDLHGNCLNEVFLTPVESYRGAAPILRTEAVGSTNETPIWQFGGLAPDAQRQYGFTKFAITLNELTLEGVRNLPPTDSRFRPDMRALENGEPTEASAAKLAIEDQNRALASDRRKAGEKYVPAWFEKRKEETCVGCPGPFGKNCNAITNATSLWVYCGAYWEQRESGTYHSPPVVHDPRFDVFGLAVEYRNERDRRRGKLLAQGQRNGLDAPPVAQVERLSL